jgi:hypothetical protein
MVCGGAERLASAGQRRSVEFEYGVEKREEGVRTGVRTGAEDQDCGNQRCGRAARGEGKLRSMEAASCVLYTSRLAKSHLPHNFSNWFSLIGLQFRAPPTTSLLSVLKLPPPLLAATTPCCR